MSEKSDREKNVPITRRNNASSNDASTGTAGKSVDRFGDVNADVFLSIVGSEVEEDGSEKIHYTGD